ncbi:MAG: HAD-IG family 5'-nucleotidase [Myxococcales bacterium]|nr:HAD-IG family 5'-nucleotidase [Myxococcales bacterium]
MPDTNAALVLAEEERESLLPPWDRQIFACRDLSLRQVDWIGFDMDYTLLRYHTEAIEQLSYEVALQKLVEMGYPEALLGLRYDPQRAIRGVLVDKELGHLLQMDRHRRVGVAYHGHRRLTPAECAPYHAERLSVSSSARFYLVDTIFSIPEACLFCDLVEWVETQGLPNFSTWEVMFEDVRRAVDRMHAEGHMHRAVISDVDRYLCYEPEVGQVLQRFRASGKKLFLLTNSGWEYTQHVMGYLLGNKDPLDLGWQNLFDMIVVSAGKPSFFVEDRPFVWLDRQGQPLSSQELPVDGPCRAVGGSLQQMNDLFGVVGERILYVGDHLYGDVLSPKKRSNWRTMWIFEELEEELRVLRMLAAELEEREHLWAEQRLLESERSYQLLLFERLRQERTMLGPAGGSILEERICGVQDRIAQLQQEERAHNKRLRELDARIAHPFNPHWGMRFREQREYSYMAEQMRGYACLYASRVSNFLFYPPVQFFHAPQPPLPHEQALQLPLHAPGQEGVRG